MALLQKETCIQGEFIQIGEADPKKNPTEKNPYIQKWCDLYYPWNTMAKTHRMLYLYRSFSAKGPPFIFPQKSPVNSGSFAENEMQFKAYNGSAPLCTRWSNKA